jgi:hypothetical protein
MEGAGAGVKWLAHALALVASLHCASAAAETWKLSVNDADALPRVTISGVDAVTSHYAFWERNWKWAGVEGTLSRPGTRRYAHSGNSEVLGLRLEARADAAAARLISWEFELTASRALSGVIGGGIAFHFDLTAFPDLGLPELLPANRGWAWGRGGQRMEMRFDPAPARVYFEQGQRTEIRVFFYDGNVPQGALRHKATLEGTGDVATAPTAEERFGLADHRAWPAGVIDWSGETVDLSFLNAAERPAGKHGFVKAVGEDLRFADGAQARFWGTNLSSAAIFSTSRGGVRTHARRLSKLGFNLVRMHHQDSVWANPNIFGDGGRKDTRVLSAAMLEKLDFWIAELKAQGIYVWLDLHVQRHFKPGDGIPKFEEMAKGSASADLKGFSYVNGFVREAMKKFNEDYLTHVNVHTGLRYADDPAIVAVLVTNENDVTHHFGNSLLPDKNVPWHNREYMARAEEFARRHGLPKDKVWRSWEQGPSKLFLNDLEHQFNVEMIRHLRGVGVKVPIVTTSYWGLEPLSSLPALTDGDIVDAHSYAGVGDLDRSPLRAPNFVHWLAAAQVAGKPFSVTEWNVEGFPAADRHRAPLYVAATAAHQGWDAVMLYAYGQASLDGEGNASNWHAHNDPALLAMLPAAALLYRQGHVREGRKTYVLAPLKAALFDTPITPATSAAIRTASEVGRLVAALPNAKELPWLEKSQVSAGAAILADPARSQLPLDAAEVHSGTGELRRTWGDGVFTVDTPHTQAASGWIGGKTIRLRDVEIAAATRNASVVVQSLDGKPISESRSLLLSLAARALPREGNRLPFHSEPVEAQLLVRAGQGLGVYRLGAAPGARLELPHVRRDRRYEIATDARTRAVWAILRPPSTQ